VAERQASRRNRCGTRRCSGETAKGPTSPEEICRPFQNAIVQGDVDRALDVFEPDAPFLGETGDIRRDRHAMREVLLDLAAQLAARNSRLDFRIIAIVEADGIALMLTEWQATDAAPQHAIEIACRQPDGNVALARRGPVHGR
jgi:hypothetical protein